MKKILGGFLAAVGVAAVIVVGAEAIKRIKEDQQLKVGTADLDEILPEGFDEDEAAQKLEEEGVVAPLKDTPYENEDNTPGSEIKVEEGEENGENITQDIGDVSEADRQA